MGPASASERAHRLTVQTRGACAYGSASGAILGPYARCTALQGGEELSKPEHGVARRKLIRVDIDKSSLAVVPYRCQAVSGQPRAIGEIAGMRGLYCGTGQARPHAGVHWNLHSSSVLGHPMAGTCRMGQAATDVRSGPVRSETSRFEREIPFGASRSLSCGNGSMYLLGTPGERGRSLYGGT